MIRFDEDEDVRLLEAIYTTPDMVFQRHESLLALNLKPGERVLDIGAGHGFLASEMGKAVCPDGRVDGIDSSPGMVEAARVNCANQRGVEFREGDALKLPYGESSFNAVTAIQVFEYLEDVAGALGEAYRVLCPGGRLLIMDTDWDSPVWHSNDAARMDRMLRAWTTHCRDPYLPRKLAPMLKRAGFHLAYQASIPIENIECDAEDFDLESNASVTNFSSGLINSIRRHIAARTSVPEEEVSAWTDDLRRLSRQGKYYFRLNRSLFLAVKP